MTTLVLSCEHGGNRIPPQWAELFASREAQAALASHRGWDPGTAEATQLLAEHTGAATYIADTSRLLVDLNRSLGHPRLFSEFTRGLGREDRDALVEQVWQPHRDAVTGAVATALDGGDDVLHLALHSFTPALDPARRDFAVGLLYDPASAGERELCADWARQLRAVGTSVRRNQPYRGASDGLCATMRERWGTARYLGVEIEMSQALSKSGANDALVALLTCLQASAHL